MSPRSKNRKSLLGALSGLCFLAILLSVLVPSVIWGADPRLTGDNGAPVKNEDSVTLPGKLICLDFTNADLINVLCFIAEIGDFNLICDGDVKGTITIKLKNVTWEEALETILASQGLVMVRMGNIVTISPK